MANNTNLSFPSAFCQQFFKDGKPLSSGKLYTYIAGSSTSVVTYKTISGGTESANMNTNPIILDMNGMADLVISKDTAYKFVLFDRNDVKVDEWDNVTAGGSEGGGGSEEIVVDGTTNEINVTSNITQGVKHYVVSLSNTIKSAILRLLGLYENVAISLESKLDKNGDASNTTSTFTIASSRTNISSGENLSVIFGKIAKWFTDLKAVAFSGSYTDLSDKPTIPAAANDGVLTIKQNGTSAGTFSANQSSNTEINVTDTTYESKPEASGGTAVSLVTTGDKYTWNHKQDALPTTGTPSSTFAINVSGTANNANSLNNVLVCSSFEIGSSFGKVGIVNFGSEGKGRILLEIHVCRYLNGDNSVIFAEFGSDHENILGEARILNPSCPYNVYYKSTGNTYEYEVWVCDDTITGGGTRRGSVIADVSKVSAWTPVTNVSPSTRPSGLTQFTTWHVAMTKNGAGSSRLPIYVNADGTFSPMNIDEYYCWAQPTPQWTDVMEMAVWYVQNECNNEILGSTRNINLNATHPSLCYLHVKLPELQGAGRYRFTLEFEITNSNGQNGTSAYGVLLLDPPTGYSGEPFLAECCYDSSGRAQSSVMNQIHVPPQGSTYRHKLYVDGHTYRVVKTK